MSERMTNVIKGTSTESIGDPVESIELSDRENSFTLERVDLENGSVSDIKRRYSATMQLLHSPSMGEPLQWIDKAGNTRLSSQIVSIHQKRMGGWRIETKSSVYELTHLPSITEKKEDTSNDRVRFDLEAWRNDPLITQDMKEALATEAFLPVSSIELEGKVFHASKTFYGERYTCFVYTEDRDGSKQLCIYYKSYSDGGWRLNAPTPYHHNKQDFSKGLISNDGRYRHYTKETKPHEAVAMMLDSLPNHRINKDDYLNHFVIRKNNKCEQNFEIYKNSIVSTGDQPIHVESVVNGGVNIFVDKQSRTVRIDRGHIYGKTELTAEALKSISYPEGFVPDFSKKPTKTYHLSHSILSEKDEAGYSKKNVRIEVFQGTVKVKNTPLTVDWHMATSPTGDVWVEKIIPEDCHVNRFGTYDKLYDFGIFDLKPLEYDFQANQIPNQYKEEIAGEYVKITDFLSLLQPIQEYKKMRPL